METWVRVRVRVRVMLGDLAGIGRKEAKHGEEQAECDVFVQNIHADIPKPFVGPPDTCQG